MPPKKEERKRDSVSSFLKNNLSKKIKAHGRQEGADSKAQTQVGSKYGVRYMNLDLLARAINAKKEGMDARIICDYIRYQRLVSLSTAPEFITDMSSRE